MSRNDEFKRSMEKAATEIVLRACANMKVACAVVERSAKINCPVDTGELRASIFSDVQADKNIIQGVVGANSEIAPYVHQGTGIYAVNGDGRKTPWKYCVKAGKYKGFHVTVGQKPNPFLDKAKQSNISRISSILAGIENG